MNIPAQGGNSSSFRFIVVALYFSFDNGVTWSILGTVTGNAPRYVFNSPFHVVVSSAQVGEQLESRVAAMFVLVFL